MPGLYNVYVVDPQEQTLVVANIAGIIAGDDEEAKAKGLAGHDLPKDLAEYDVIVERLGDVRPKGGG